MYEPPDGRASARIASRVVVTRNYLTKRLGRVFVLELPTQKHETWQTRK